jgi:hypothetical protein
VTGDELLKFAADVTDYIMSSANEGQEAVSAPISGAA